MNSDTAEQLEEAFSQLICAYSVIKNIVKKSDTHLFERWKAGGFLVDTTIVSMYPNLLYVVENLLDKDDDLEQ